jgi:hypothetical protein
MVVDVKQPLFSFLQHHAFFSTDHPDSAFAKPALQSKGKLVVDV